MAEGGLHEPSGRRATRTPEPVAAENWKPIRAVVKMARPTALARTFWGIRRMARLREREREPRLAVPSAGSVGVVGR